MKFCLFLVSYFPLFVIMGILHHDNPIISYSLIFFSASGFVGLLIIFYVLNRINGIYEKSSQIESANEINFQYFLAYIIPFVTIDVDSTRQMIAYLVLMTFICILYMRTGLIYVNPTLNLLGYNLFKIKIGNKKVLLITKNDQDNILKHPIISIDRNLYYERKYIQN